MPEWFSIRKNLLEELINKPKWKHYFSDFDITPFALYSKSEDAFREKYQILSSEEKSKQLCYIKKDFKKFIMSWLPEIRQIKSTSQKYPSKQKEIIDKFLDKMIDKIPYGDAQENRHCIRLKT